MKVHQVIQSTRAEDGAHPEPVVMKLYNGDDEASAIVAIAQAIASRHSDPDWVRILSVTVVF